MAPGVEERDSEYSSRTYVGEYLEPGKSHYSFIFPCKPSAGHQARVERIGRHSAVGDPFIDTFGQRIHPHNVGEFRISIMFSARSAGLGERWVGKILGCCVSGIW